MREELMLQEFELDEYEELDFNRPRSRGRNKIVEDYEIDNIEDRDYEIEDVGNREDFDRFINEYNRC